jgi:hypothetical protein
VRACVHTVQRDREHTGFFFAASGAFTPLLGACRQYKNKLINENWEKKLFLKNETPTLLILTTHRKAAGPNICSMSSQ